MSTPRSMRWVPVAWLLSLLLPAPAAAQTYVDKLVIGAADSSSSASVLSITGLGPRTPGQGVLSISGTDVFAGALGTADIPAPFTRDDVAEVINHAWDFAAGLTGDLNVAGIISPTATTGLPVNAAGRLILGAGFSSPDAGRLYFGDGTGWKLHFTSRNSSTNVDRFTFTDTGRFEFFEHLLPFSNYVSDAGSSSRKLRSLHAGELFLETLVAQERITTMGGRFTVTPSNILTRDIASGTGSNITMCVKYNSFLLYVGGVEWGSKLLMEKNGQFEWFLVTSTSVPTVDPVFGDYCYTVDRNADGSGQNAWTAGDGIVDTGKIGSGMIDQFAVRGLQSATIEGPSIDFLVRTADGVGGLSHRASLGNLNGRYGYSADTFGLAAGSYAATWIAADQVHGFRVMYGTTVKFQADASGNVALDGNVYGPNWNITGANGLYFTAGTTSTPDVSRSVQWSNGARLYGYSSGSDDFLLVDAEQLALSSTVKWSARGGTSSVFAMGLELTADNAVITGPGSGTAVFRPGNDGAIGLGGAGYRWRDPYFSLNTNLSGGTATYAVVGKADGALGYFVPSFGAAEYWIPVRSGTAGTLCYIVVRAGLVHSTSCT